MIQCVEGKGVGSGKSYMACEFLIHHFRQGGTAFASESFRIKWDKVKALCLKRWGLHLEDDQYRAVSAKDIVKLHSVTSGGSDDMPVLLLIDEAQDQLNARDWGDKDKRELFSWACQSRHDNNSLIFISQSAFNIDKQIRRLATYTWTIRNMATFPIPGLGKVGNIAKVLVAVFTLGLVRFHGIIFARTLLDADGRTSLERKFVIADRAIFDCYESKSMSHSRQRLGQPILKKKLKKEESKMLYFRVLVPIAVICLIYGVYHIAKHGLFPTITPPKREPLAMIAEPVAKVAEAREARPSPEPAYDIVRDKLLSAGPRWIKTATLGTFTQGQMSALGMTDLIYGHSARVVRPDGRTAYVLGEDWSVPGKVPEQRPKEKQEIIYARDAAAEFGSLDGRWKGPSK